ncbi:glycosyltransferase family 2 protein [Marinobacterium sp. xm-a-152]|uniref:glycosyltransferase family 2 protein n=1 Tax=Marinobacterium sp. xm-a-152 TaxID=2497733 RepID=UPI001569EFDE|nr:glycosyltransferase [Marinobacterium sp. xm-a-152]NRP15191.1 N-acetylglucosaminyl-diphospho-decaprenol L-rhamnosyltransferase [Marinobacterium sp. xm-a-152]
MENKLLSIIIVTHNSESIIVSCLENLSGSQDIEIVVVDCGSSDGTIIKANRFNNVKVIQEKNIGYGCGNNSGFSHTSAENILILNPDVIISLSQVRRLLDIFSNSNRESIMSVKMFQQKEGKRIFRRDSRFQERFSYETRLSGALMLMRRKTFARLGGFDNSIFLYFEEIDLCYRAAAAGIDLKISGEVEVEHLRAGSTPDNTRYEKLRGWHDGWSKCYLISKHECRVHKRFFRLFKVVLQTFLKATISLFLPSSKSRRREYYKLEGMLSFLRGESSFTENGVGRFSIDT